ncbi:MAG: autotransporter-associated beta strand repeat-containing protein [Verrucomicrobiota bacterium]
MRIRWNMVGLALMRRSYSLSRQFLRRSLTILGLVALFAQTGELPAATKTWVGGGAAANGNWGLAGNWSPSGGPASGDNLIFNGTLKQNSTNNNQVTSLGWITLSNGGWAIFGSKAVDFNGHFTNIAGINFWNIGVTNSVDRIYQIAAGFLTNGGILYGSGGLIKTGPGTNVIRGANVYTGNTFVKDGALRLDTGNNRIPITSVVTLGDASGTSGRIELNSRSQTVAGLTTVGGASNRVVNSSGTLVTFTVTNTSDYSYSGDLGGPNANDTKFAFTKSGTGTLTLLGTNTYTGDTTLSGGVLKLGAAERIPDGSGKGNVTINGTLDLNSFSETVNGLSGSGIIDNISGGGTSALTVGNNNVSSSFSGVIKNTSGTLAVTKTGTGTVTLLGSNTYSGVTLVSNGKLILGTVHAGGGAITVSDGKTLGFTNTIPGSTLFSPTLNLGSSIGPVTNEFNFGSGNPTAPVVLATNLTVAAGSSVYVNVSGLGLSVGTVTLLGYSNANNVTGTTFVGNTLPSGVTGYITNDTTASALLLVITKVPSLVWTGATNAPNTELVTLTGTGTTNLAFAGVLTNTIVVTDSPFTTTYAAGVDYSIVTAGNVTGIQRIPAGGITDGQSVSVTYTGIGGLSDRWDIGITANWKDIIAGIANPFLSGLVVALDDTSLTNLVTLVTNVSPLSITVSNETKAYTLTNFLGTEQIQGPGTFTKDGAATLTVAVSSNTYLGDTIITKGTFKLGKANVIPDGAGKGNVQVGANGTLDLGGYSDTINGLNGSGTIDNSGVAGVTNTLSVGSNNTAVAFSGTLKETTGALALQKVGTNTLTLTGNGTYSGGTLLAGGTLQLGQDGALGFGALAVANASLATYGGPRNLTNAVSATGSTFGIDTSAGNLALLGPIALSVTTLTKTGTNDLRIASAVPTRSGSIIELYQGGLVLDGGSWTNENSAIRLFANGTDVVRLAITNNASLTVGNVSGSLNLRLGYTAGLTGTNVFDISSGQLILDQYFVQIYVGDTANTFALVNQTGGSVKFQSNTTATAGLLLGSSAGSVGTYNFDGGILETPRVVGGSGTGYFYFNGGTLRPSSSGKASTFFTGVTATYIKDGGAIIDTTNIDLTIAQPLLAGGTGGLTKNGVGTLTFTGTNTYTGATLVNQGHLSINTTHAGGGAFSIADGAQLNLSLASSGTSLNVAGLTVGASGATTLNLNLGAFGNPTAPVINATNLVANGTSTINLAGGNFALGQFPLIAYTGAIGGSGFSSFSLGSLPVGVQGNLVDNAANSSVDLLITFVNPLVWSGLTDTNWNTTGTVNWKLTGSDTSYSDGSGVRFDDSAVQNTNVNLASALLPASVTVSNEVLSVYSFSGPGKISGLASLTKQGAGTLVISNNNDFTGSVTISGGTLVATHSNALGSVAGGTIITNGGTLDVFGSLLNRESITVSGAGVGGNGAIVNNGAAAQNNATRFVTLAGDTTLGGTQRWDVRGTATANAVLGTGGQPYKLTKVGPNFVSLVYAQVDPALGDIEVKEGGLGFEVSTTSLGNPTNTLTIFSNAYVQFWLNTHPLDKNVLLSDGGQIKGGSGTSNYVVGPVTVPGGFGQLGAAANSSLTVASGISGAGGVKKLLPGIVTLTGTNTYVGATLISAGTLVVSNAYSISNSANITLAPGTTFDVSGVANGYNVVAGQTLVGRGTVLGPLAIQPGGQLAIDGASPDTLVVSNALSLGGTTALRLGRIAGVVTNDRIIGVSSLTVGGTLNLSLATNSEALQAGDTFQLFQANTFSGAFASVNLPVLGTGVAWDTNSLLSQGVLAVLHVPVITQSPSSQTVSGGDTVSLHVAASGYPAPVYEWFFNGNTLVGNGATLTLSNVVPAHAGSYYAIASNALGTATSDVAVLTVQGIAPYITQDPASTNVVLSNTVTLVAGVAGNPPLALQWFVNRVPIAGANGGSLSLSNLTCAGGQYYLQASNAFGVSTNSLIAYVTVSDTNLPVITALSVTNIALSLGDSTNVTATLGPAVSCQPATYLWYLNATNFVTNVAALAMTNVQAANAGTYTLVVTNVNGAATSGPVTLTVGSPLQITQQPTPATVLVTISNATDVTFTAAVSNGNSLSYQWYFDTNTVIGFGTTASLTLTNVQKANEGYYSLVVTNPFGAAVTSQVAQLIVNRPPIATNQGATTLINVPLPIPEATLRTNSVDPDNDPITLVNVSTTSANGGEVVWNSTTQVITYTPVSGFTGNDEFNYTITDGRGGFASAIVAIHVSATPLPTLNHVSPPLPGTNGWVTFKFAGEPGQNYAYQRTTSLTISGWTNVSEQVAPPHGILIFTDTNPPPGNAFYRAVKP